MDLYLLAELKTISLKITTVDMKRPPVDFRSNFEAAQPPILIDNGVAVLENDLIERHIMKNIPGGHNLFTPDQVCSVSPTTQLINISCGQEVSKKIENVYSKFKHMLMKRDEVSKNNLTTTLVRWEYIVKMFNLNIGTILSGSMRCWPVKAPAS